MDAAGPQVRFSTSTDGITWSDGPKLALEGSLTHMFVDLFASTTQPVTAPGTVKFDNVRIECP